MVPSENNTRRDWVAAIAWIAVIFCAAGIVLRLSPTAREVASEATLTIFRILTTPFILEATLALLGLFIVMAINHYRQQRDGDEWVYLQKQEAPKAGDVSADDPPHRHDAVIWRQRPESFDEDETAYEVIEGYLDLGLVDDALREIDTLPERHRHTEWAEALGIRAFAMAGRFADANRIVDHAVKQAGRSPRLAAAAASVALWLREKGASEEAVEEWLKRGRELDPQAMEVLPPGHPLRKE